MTEFTTRFAVPDDAVPIHRFLCVIAQPVLHAPIDPENSITEVMRVIAQDFAVLAEIDGEIVGSLGMKGVDWWYARKARFLTDRWFFVFPAARKMGVAAALLGQAGAVAHGSEMDMLINGHIKRRNAKVGRGVLFTKPQFIAAADIPEMDWDAVDRSVLMET